MAKNNKLESPEIKLLTLLLLFLFSSIFQENFNLKSASIFLIIFIFLTGSIYYCFKNKEAIINSLPDIKETAWLKYDIFLASFLCLFIELCLIRYHSCILPIFGYFKNLTLLSCFLGLGIGFCLNKSTKNFLPLTVILISVQSVLLYSISNLMPTPHNPVVEYSTTMSILPVKTGFEIMYVFSFLTIIFTLTAATCIAVGQITSSLMGKLNQLHAYGLNLAGSLIGIAFFTFLSSLSTSPIIWFSVVLITVFWLLRGNYKYFFIIGMIALIPLCIEAIDTDTFLNKKLKIYSPYQLLIADVSATKNYFGEMHLTVSHNFHQTIIDLSNNRKIYPNDPIEEVILTVKDYYNNPYSIVPNPENVLIVGAGTGNDVAAAIRGGAKSIDAVEIDPEIAKLGKNFHPELPYSNPTVMLHITDARTYMKKCNKKYDLIVYGLLDSHGSLGSLTNVRLDSFVYTVEAFKEAKSLLKEKGIVSLSFQLMHPLQGTKIFKMLKAAFGQNPICLKTGENEHDSIGGTTFLIGPGLSETNIRTRFNKSMKDYTSRYDKASNVEMSTDDWPFLYMIKHAYPLTYLIMCVWFLFISIDMSKGFLKGFSFKFFDPEYFLLGAGFMLIETKGITELGLVFGNTWYVISIIIAAILFFAFSANLFVIKTNNSNYKIPYYLLLSILFLEGLFSISSKLTFLPYELLPYAKLIILICPLFFAGIIFSTKLKTREVSSVFSSNLFGSMFGGFLEYHSMFSGYHSLTWFALVIYFAAFLSGKAKK